MDHTDPKLFTTDQSHEMMLRVPDQEVEGEAVFFMVNLN